jgi:glycyl-tRNA synthetase
VLCKRRGFIFQSSIYGGTGSVWDYGVGGGWSSEDIKDRWWNAMVFCDPLVDCKTCKGRFRADKLEDARCPQKPSKIPGQHDACQLTEARNFNLMFKTYMGALEESASIVYLRPETAQGIFVNFLNVQQSMRRCWA